jgi:hypothetical protein
MTFRDFVDNVEDFKVTSVKEKLKEAFLQYLDLDDELILDDILTGSFEFIADHEADDAFGTEGMNI